MATLPVAVTIDNPSLERRMCLVNGLGLPVTASPPTGHARWWPRPRGLGHRPGPARGRFGRSHNPLTGHDGSWGWRSTEHLAANRPRLAAATHGMAMATPGPKAADCDRPLSRHWPGVGGLLGAILDRAGLPWLVTSSPDELPISDARDHLTEAAATDSSSDSSCSARLRPSTASL